MIDNKAECKSYPKREGLSLQNNKMPGHGNIQSLKLHLAGSDSPGIRLADFRFAITVEVLNVHWQKARERDLAHAHSDYWRGIMLIQEDMSHCYPHCSDGKTEAKIFK